MSESISLFIVVFTLVNIAACAWLMWWSAKIRTSPKPPQSGSTDQVEKGTVEKTGHVWDGDLEEYNNPLPKWWLGLFVMTILFGMAYLLLYPGLGRFAGMLGWSQKQQHAVEVQAAQTALEARLAGTEQLSIADLSKQPGAMSIARNLFGLYCSTCHGSDARGARGFPNLTDQDWLWGGAPETILQTISQGRNAAMPAWGDVLGQKGVEDVMAYVFTLSGRKAPLDMVAEGKERYAMLCVACHGVDGVGNAALGAPNLTDNIWLYGGDSDALRESISKGRNGSMPPHADLLGPVKTRLLAAYVYGLNKP